MNAGRFVAIVVAAALVTEVSLAEIPYKTRQDIVRYGASAIGSPYIWGGDDPTGLDCSGLVVEIATLAGPTAPDSCASAGH